MADFSDIKGVGKAGTRLLEAAGIHSLAELADSDASALFAQLSAINRDQRIARQAPPRKVVAAWIDAAEQLVAAGHAPAEASRSAAGGEEAGGFSDPEAYEAALRRAPSARILYDEDGARVPPPGARSAPLPTEVVVPIEEVAGKRPLDRTRIPTFEDLREGRVAVQPLGSTLGEASPRPRPRPSPDGSAPLNLERPPARPSPPASDGTSEVDDAGREEDPATSRDAQTADETDVAPVPAADAPRSPVDTGDAEEAVVPAAEEGDDAASSAQLERLRLQRIEGKSGDDHRIIVPRWVRRGVSYPEPVKLYLGMLVVLASRLLFLAVAIGAPVVFLLRWLTGRDYVTGFIPVLIAFAVVGILHLIVAAYFRCRICTCHFLFSRRCHKNKKAHRPFPLGWVGSTALHAILFRWFRCMYCGTAIQLGEQKRPSS